MDVNDRCGTGVWTECGYCVWAHHRWYVLLMQPNVVFLGHFLSFPDAIQTVFLTCPFHPGSCAPLP